MSAKNNIPASEWTQHIFKIKGFSGLHNKSRLHACKALCLFNKIGCTIYLLKAAKCYLGNRDIFNETEVDSASTVAMYESKGMQLSRHFAKRKQSFPRRFFQART